MTGGRRKHAVFDAAERDAWLPPRDVLPSDWAETHRELFDGETNIPGPWRNALTPYGRGMMDIPMKPGVWQAFFEKGSQLGVSEMVRNFIAHVADNDPDPIGLILPDRAKGRKIVSERVLPMFERTPRLRRLLTGKKSDRQKEVLKLANAFTLWLAWAGSASATASDPWRVAIIDELDKCARAVCATPDVVGRAWQRTKTFGDRRKLIALGTPTDQFSEIHAQVEACRYILLYYLPCPHCGAWILMDMGQIRWARPKNMKGKHDLDGDQRRRLAAWLLENEKRTWHECIHCSGKATEAERPAMVRAGKWCTASAIDKAGHARKTNLAANRVFDAEAVEEFPRGSTVGMRIWTAYSLLGVTLSSLAAEFLAAQGDRGRMYVFTTETEGRPYDEQIQRADEGVFRAKVLKARKAKLAEGVVPAWAGKLLAAIDTQVDHFYVVIRAWGADFLSQRIWHGKIGTFAELETICFETPWASEDPAMGPLVCEAAGIDTGGTTDIGADSSRTVEVYRWSQRNRARVRALKGFDSSRTGQYIWRGRGILPDVRSIKRKREVALWCLAKSHWQTVLADLIVRGTGKDDDDEEIWLLNNRTDGEYEKHMANARQVVERHGTRPIEVWKPLHPAGRWDYRDCEVYQIVMANLARVDLLPPTEQIIEFRREMWKQARAATKENPDGVASAGRSDGGGWARPL